MQTVFLLHYSDYCGAFPMTLVSFEIRALFNRRSFIPPGGLIHVCEKAVLVSQTLNRALALITANLRPLPVITDAAAAADSSLRPAQKYT